MTYSQLSRYRTELCLAQLSLVRQVVEAVAHVEAGHHYLPIQHKPKGAQDFLVKAMRAERQIKRRQERPMRMAVAMEVVQGHSRRQRRDLMLLVHHFPRILLRLVQTQRRSRVERRSALKQQQTSLRLPRSRQRKVGRLRSTRIRQLSRRDRRRKRR